MNDLEALLPQQTPTVKAILAYHKAQGDAEPERGYLGASIVGHECDRFLWYSFRGVLREERDGRVYRLLETGDLAEERFVRELRAIGAEVWDRDDNGGQFEVSALGGHLSGHLDGIALGLPEAPKTAHLVETKTAKDSIFKKIEKEGVRKAKPMHFAQMQTYMGLQRLTRALYLVVNKDNDDLYGERVEFEPEFFKSKVLDRAKRIIESSQAPQKCATRADDFRCKFCPGHSLCWGSDEVAVPIKGGQACRTCCHATALTDRGGSQWSCAKYETPIEDTAVGAECPGHLLLPGFVSFAEPSDADADWIEFTNADGTKWRLGPEPGQFTAKQLMAGRGPLEDPRKADSLSADAPAAPVTAPSQVGGGSPPERVVHEAPESPPGPDPTLAVPPATTDLSAVTRSASASATTASRTEADEEAEGRRVAEESLLAVNLDDLPLLSRYPWDDSEKLWDGPVEDLADAIADLLGEAANLPEPRRTQADEAVNASEHVTEFGDYLIVYYKASETGAIWRGKE